MTHGCRTWALAGAVLLVAGCTVEWSGGATSFVLHKVQSERVDEIALPLAAGGELRAKELCGDVDVRVDSGPARMVVRWKGYGMDAADAQLALAEARVDVTGDAAAVDLRAIVPMRDGQVRARADLELVLPQDVALRLDTSTGDLVVAGPVRSAELETRYGDVRANAITGDVRARSSSGDVELSTVGGVVEAVTAYGDVTLRACTGSKVEATSSSGNVAASDGGDANWRLESKYGDVRLAGGAGTLSISTSSGRVVVTGFTGSVRARDGYGDVELTGRFSGVDAESSSGDVRVRLEEVAGELREVVLESRYGNVELVVCVALDAELVATTRYGEVDCDLPIAVTRRDEDGKRLEGRLAAPVGPEAPAAGAATRLRLSTASGDVRVRRGGR